LFFRAFTHHLFCCCCCCFYTSLPKEIDFQKSDWLRVTPSFSRKKKLPTLPFSPPHFRNAHEEEVSFFLSFFLLVLCISRAGENDEVYEIPSVGVTHRLICRFLCPFECVRAVVVLFSHRRILSRPRGFRVGNLFLLPPISGSCFDQKTFKWISVYRIACTVIFFAKSRRLTCICVSLFFHFNRRLWER